MRFIDINPLYSRIRSNLEAFLRDYSSRNGTPSIALLKVGNDPASESYFRSKENMCRKLNIKSVRYNLEPSAGEREIRKVIMEVSESSEIDGILLENVLPGGISYGSIMDIVPPLKDLDGASSLNLGMTEKGLPSIEPATSRAVLETLNYLQIPQGTKVCIINRSITVGKPLSMMLLNRNFSPLICHSRTLNLQEEARMSPVVVSAVGKPGFINSNFLSGGSTVIDVGINSVQGKLVGDVDIEDLDDADVRVTPVPGGIGRLTSILVFDNLRIALERRSAFKGPK